MCRYGKLDKYPGNVIIVIELIYQVKKFFFSCILAKLERSGSDTDILACLLLVADIHAACRIVSDLDHGAVIRDLGLALVVLDLFFYDRTDFFWS